MAESTGILRRMAEERQSPESPTTNLANPATWLIDWFEGRPTASGVRVTEERALGISTFFACVRLICDSVAGLPLVLYRRLEDGGRERASDDPMFAMFHEAPNPFMNTFTFLETLQFHLLVNGNAYAEIEFDGQGRPVALWPLLPDRVRVEVQTGRQFSKKYVVTLPEGVEVGLPADRVLHVPGLGTTGLVGREPIRLLRETLGVSAAADEFAGRFFANSATPAGVIQHPERLTDTAVSRMRDSIQMLYGGLSKAHRVMILEEGAQFNPVSMSPEASQLLASRRFHVEEIARIFRIPLVLLSTGDNISFGSGIEEFQIMFMTHTIRPWLVRWERAINTQVMAQAPGGRELFVEFLPDAVLRGDTLSRYRAYAVGRQWGWLSANEIRARENLNPVGGGDALFVPMNLMPVGDLASVANPSETPGKRSADPLPLWRRRLEIARSFAPVFLDLFSRSVRREVKVLRTQARRLRGERQTPGDLRDFLRRYYDEEHQRFLRLTGTPIVEALAMSIRAVLEEELGQEVPEDLVRRAAVRHARRLSIRYGRISFRELEKRLEEAGSRAADEVLDEVADQWEETKAEKFAGVEGPRAHHLVVAMVASGAGAVLVWRTTGTSNCQFCEALEGKRVTAGEPFIGKDEQLTGVAGGGIITSARIRYPPLHFGCDCTLEIA